MTESINAGFLRNEIAWFRQVLDLRMKLHAGDAETPADPMETAGPPPPLAEGAPYADVIRKLGLGPAERLVLLLAYLPHVRPDLLDVFFIQNRALERRFTEFGGVTGLSHGGYLPTGETAMFLLAGEDLEARLRYRALFHPEHPFYAENVLRLDHRHPEEPPLAAILQLTAEYVERLATGRSYQPPFSPEFPAQRITTAYEWDDLVLDDAAREEVEDILAWARHQDTLMRGWGLEKRLKPGFRALFYGSPGTGKTLTASLLGKATGRPVYRVDLSRVVSKWIGETEKNLASLFDHAQHQDWILFFDEADSLFGQRTEGRDANDRAANQQISYLLQRIEDFPGVVILATNLRSHLDEAFARRFQSVIYFAMPDAERRLRLWEDHFRNRPYRLAADVDLPKLARDYELAGGSILNVLRYACLKAVSRKPWEVRSVDLIHGIRRELQKEGKFMATS
jgi:AAA+ superfamily predicted ATPase